MRQVTSLILLSFHLLFASPVMAADTLKIVATLPPIHSLVAMLTEGMENVELSLLLPKGANPHHFSLKPSQAKMLEDADLVFYASRQNETFLRKSDRLQPEKFSPLFDTAKTPDELSTHGWLSPDQAIQALLLIAQRMSSLEPSLKPQAKETLKRASEQLSRANVTWQQHLKNPESKMLFVDSSGLSSLAKAFDLQVKLLDASSLLPIGQGVPGCMLITHGNNPGAQRFHETFNYPLYHVDLIGHDLPIGKNHYYLLMNRLVSQISRCFT